MSGKGLKAYKSGYFAEKIARIFLRLKGYKILDHNVRMKKGMNACELDVVALKNAKIHFIEVKKRTSIDMGAYSITPLMQKRIYKGAMAYLSGHKKAQKYDAQFDAILISFGKIKHIQNVFYGD